MWIPEIVFRWWATEQTQQKLNQLGLPWKAVEFAAFHWILLSVGLVGVILANWATGLTLLSGFMGMLLLAAVLFGPAIWLDLAIDHRRQEIDLSIADFLDRVSLALGAGLGFEVALDRSAATFPGRLGSEFRRLNRQLNRGKLKKSALDELAARNPSNDLRAFISSIKQSDKLGTSLAEALQLQSDMLRKRRRRRAHEASRRLPILIVFPLVFFFLPALMLVYLAPPLLFLFLNR
jgi:tight adherence protein C